jgi:hypothetical protein
MHFGFMNVILLYIDHRHILAIRMAILRVVSARIQMVFWDHSTMKITSEFMALFFWVCIILICGVSLKLFYESSGYF